MKDVYFFYVSEVDFCEIYGVMDQVYCCIFECCGLDVVFVDVDSGVIGGVVF